ncbi:hypothetical protein L228DRAFT_244176 [Xylona heveae TC161]|uniref:Histone deacetylase complex subunit SAP30 Sin3 binding domain-containing protein n=1 Tax=Xylona heveae (strain CBS 132557 / TC161) TaxID=1328760 RepID=A0A165ITA2_XYLHT|nr:hypothetical protein L228DRAFT_244176 [Xylona heveae TC161]KZF25356.1 hypothetical protein L228DRAFT_244176 [Xylona heveae TC161]
MAPPRVRPAPDDSRSEASSTKERVGTSSGQKGRRNPMSSLAASTLAKDTAAFANTATGVPVGTAAPELTGLHWPAVDRTMLHAYRYAYRLKTPSSFASHGNQIILSNPGIGRYSPTMARNKERRRVSREQLSTAVRKNFNSLGIQESEVVVDFLYKVRWQDKSFRMRFAPTRPR